MKGNANAGVRSFLLLTLILSAVLAFLFHKSFVPGQALFSNDGPLGIILSRPLEMPDAFLGMWTDLYWIGVFNGNLNPNVSGLIHWILQGIARVNFYCPASVLILGLFAWVYFRRIGCDSRTSILASLAAALNTNFFSNAAWGLGTRGLSLGAAFLALAAVETGALTQSVLISVLASILAGLAIGLSITEGGDNGAIFSMFIGSYALWRTWISIPSRGKAAVWALGKVAVMIVFAGIMVSQTLELFVRTSVKGVVGVEQKQQTREEQDERWNFATQWSLPKSETLRVIIPGLFGYHMQAFAHEPASSYWGRVGAHPSAPWASRSSGAGEYAGVMVVLIALWAVFESLRNKGQTFTATERKVIWFWVCAGLVAMVLGWGRHAPFYRFVYEFLPYFKTIRNPMKFFHALHLCIMILFAYGLMGLNRRYLNVPAKANALLENIKGWWAKAPSHEKHWTWACITAAGLGAVAWFGYMGSRSSLVKHLTETGFTSDVAASIASFSIREVFWFMMMLVICIVVLVLIFSGTFAGNRAKWGALLLGIVLVADLARADKPWIIYYNWKQKYATNPVFDTLREKPYEHRVAFPNLRMLVQLPDVRQYFMQQPRVFSVVEQMYGIYQGEWLQHQMPYLDIQSLDMSQEPRLPADKQAYLNAMGLNWARLWELTNVRYLFGEASSFPEMLNQKFDPGKRRFRVHTAFGLFQKEGGIGVQTNATGPYALIEFTGALPRAMLVNNWEIIPEESALLARLGDPGWDPVRSVLLMAADAPRPTATNATPGKAEIVSNPSPRLMEIQTTSDAPALLLLNDKIEPEWHAYIDGKEAPVLRANYLMRAVHVPAGSHKVVFKYEVKPTGFFLVLACEIAGLLILGFVLWSARRRARTAPAAA
jgi:hypothetical protein